MTEVKTGRGRLQLLLIAAVFLGPLALATWMYYAGQLQPENPEVLNLRGQVMRSTDPKQARNLFAQAIEKSPEDPRLRYELGITFAGMGAYLEAVDRLQQAIKIDPGFAEAYFQLGRSYRELGRNRDALYAVGRIALAYLDIGNQQFLQAYR